jgi:hypothetical protein
MQALEEIYADATHSSNRKRDHNSIGQNPPMVFPKSQLEP